MNNDFLDYRNNYLVHHGILGQKWGKKNGPPYPLNPSDHSTSEKKAGWRKSLKVSKNKVKNKSGSRSSNTLREARKKDINQLSNKELREFNERLNLERQFTQNTRDNGAKYITNILSTAATSLVTATLIGIGKEWLKSKGLPIGK